MKKGNHKAYARALYELTQGKHGVELNKIIERFVAHLSKARMLKQADRIIDECIHYAKAQEGIVEIEIESAYELADSTLNRIKKVFGDNVEAETKHNPSLLGGVVVRSRDTIFDASLATQLNNLEMKLAL